MLTIESNLSIGTKNKNLTNMGFDDYYVITFQCSKTTKAEKIKNSWKFALKYEKNLNEEQDNDDYKDDYKSNDDVKLIKKKRRVIIFLDEIGLAEPFFT